MGITTSHNILVVGLPGSGKNSVIQQFKKNMPNATFKTEKMKLNTSTYEYSNHISRSQFVSFDRFSLVIVVLDGADIQNPKAVEYTFGIDLAEKMLAQRVPVLFLANKCDKKDFNGEIVKTIVSEIATKLPIDYCLQVVSAKTGEGIKEAAEWGTKNAIEPKSNGQVN
jgi:GTPase SAR1 family protein